MSLCRKVFTLAATVCGLLVLAAPLRAQTVQTPSLPMGSYTNDFSAPMPG